MLRQRGRVFREIGAVAMDVADLSRRKFLDQAARWP